MILIFILLFILGFLLLLLVNKQAKSFGVLTQNRIYSDSETKGGKVLFSKSLSLLGKPDYLIKEKGMIYPVEVKTGKTPTSPYLNHTMQLMAYCLLVEENFKIRPTGGYLKYPSKEFKIAYTDEAKSALKVLVSEILHHKQSGEELHCDHPNHKLKY